MITLVDETGKIPPHQLDAVFQSVSVVPSQVPARVIDAVTSVRVALSHPETLVSEA